MNGKPRPPGGREGRGVRRERTGTGAGDGSRGGDAREIRGDGVAVRARGGGADVGRGRSGFGAALVREERGSGGCGEEGGVVARRRWGHRVRREESGRGSRGGGLEGTRVREGGWEEARALAQRRTSAPLFFLKLRERAEVPPEGVEVRVGHRAVRAMLPLLRRRSGNIQGR